MDVEKVKLIVKNMESLVKILKQEIEQTSAPTEQGVIITPIEEDYDEVY